MRLWPAFALGLSLAMSVDVAAAQSPVVLGETTRFLAEDRGSAVVEVPETIEVSTQSRDNGSFRIGGAGGPAALVIRSVGGTGAGSLVVATGAATPGACVTADCAGDGDVLVTSHGLELRGGERPRVVVKPGLYRVYALGLGSADAVWHAGELAGTSTVPLTESVRGTIEHLPMTPQPSLGVTTFGAESHLSSAGMYSLMVATAVTARAGQRVELCVHADTPLTPVSFGPSCPGATSSHPYVFGTPGVDAVTSASSTQFGAAPGGYGLGGNAETGGAVTDVVATGLWLEYLPDPAPRVQSPPPVPSTPLVAPTPSAAPARLRVLTKAARVRRGTARVKVSCELGSDCRGSVELRKSMLPTPFAVRAGATAHLRVRLPASLRRRTARLRSRSTLLIRVQSRRPVVHSIALLPSGRGA